MKKFGLFIIVLVLICPFSGAAYAAGKGNRQIQSFSTAERILMREIYRGHQKTFYCGSQYTQGSYVIHNNGYVPKRRSKRARRLEWEYVVPLESFGTKFSEWSDGHPQCLDSRGRPFKGLNCAEKMNVKFRYMQCDLYNLVPVIGEIERLRSNSRYAMVPGENADFGKCDIEIAHNAVEPPAGVRGDIARIHFYMDWAYPGYDFINKEDRKLLKVWDREDPVDEWECKRARRIEEIQKNENPFVKKACVAQGLWQ
ncbi:MAG: endonuclease [Deltaproteobacteria bacterium]|jgi:deoxyribonuclease-1